MVLKVVNRATRTETPVRLNVSFLLIASRNSHASRVHPYVPIAQRQRLLQPMEESEALPEAG